MRRSVLDIIGAVPRLTQRAVVAGANLGGLALISYGIGMISLPAGVIAAGVGVLVFGKAVSMPDSSDPRRRP